MHMASSSYSGSPCAACKFLRRKCLPDCIFAPYFPPEEPQKFANVHKIFGASNVSKLLNEIRPDQREDAVNSLAYEAEARIKDPVYGCVGAISVLQRQVFRLQKELEATNADLIRFTCNETSGGLPAFPGTGPGGFVNQMAPGRQRYVQFGRGMDHEGESNFDHQGSSLGFPGYPSHWTDSTSGDGHESGG
ncbi:LOB domain-containing protein 25 [Malania oleifera]|uniref:LOB domain-containing protein 25 n=1 Tax=Malania oleifera TaxID=397392 RepID=UPI0025AE87EF|nr:LOB domain-containing protein 25 [Malania oleifera]XP_057983244.1 LOB domain-containing protein 25 [Malania oleifera]